MTLGPPHDWVERDLRARFPVLADQAIEAWEIARSAIADGRLEAAALSRLSVFCRDRSSRLRDWAAAVVAHLAVRFPEAQNVLAAMAGNGSQAQALAVFAGLHAQGSEELREHCFRLALRHRSSKVRALAGSHILRCELRNLLPALAQAVDVETDVDCRAELQDVLALLRDGHLMEYGTAGDVRITVAMGPATVSQHFSEAEVSEQSLSALLAGLRESARRILRFLP